MGIDSTLEEQDSTHISCSKCGALRSDDKFVSAFKFESSSRTTVQSCKRKYSNEYNTTKEGNVMFIIHRYLNIFYLLSINCCSCETVKVVQ